MIKFSKHSWEISGILKDIQRQWKHGEISTRLYCLCWQICAYGDLYTNSIPESPLKQKALEALKNE